MPRGDRPTTLALAYQDIDRLQAIITAQEQRLAYTQQERDKNELMSIQMCAERDAALEKIEAQEQRLGELEARNKIYLKSIYDAEEAAEAAGRPEGEYLAHSIEYFVSQWQQTQAKVEQFIRIYQEQDHTNQHD